MPKSDTSKVGEDSTLSPKLRSGSTTLENATILKRYKRFLVDVEQNGQEFTIYCPNTGAMTGCADAGFKAFFSTSDNTKRKYAHTLEKTVNQRGHFIGVNTIAANGIVKKAIEEKKIAELSGYQNLQTEVKYGEENSRIDILLSEPNSPDERNYCYVEVKSTTLLLNEQSGLGAFPDAKTTRGQKHVRELIEMVDQGHRAVLVFLVQHTGIKKVTVARHIDKKYGNLIDEAVQKGVEILVMHTHIDAHQTYVTHTSQFEH
ncbi:DNA/RNA nuclease SfsA [Psychrosphaera sp.]|nr:DNA/RNA nuclease SfsA [Psychrosphaera sp.]